MRAVEKSKSFSVDVVTVPDLIQSNRNRNHAHSCAIPSNELG